MSAACAYRADFAEEPATVVARIRRTVSRMKVTSRLATLREADRRPGSGILEEFRENVGLDLGTTRRALTRMPCRKQIYRERFAAARTGEMGGHPAYDTGREVRLQIGREAKVLIAKPGSWVGRVRSHACLQCSREARDAVDRIQP